jgi:hypothetical protein
MLWILGALDVGRISGQAGSFSRCSLPAEVSVDGLEDQPAFPVIRCEIPEPVKLHGEDVRGVLEGQLTKGEETDRDAGRLHQHSCVPENPLPSMRISRHEAVMDF